MDGKRTLNLVRQCLILLYHSIYDVNFLFRRSVTLHLSLSPLMFLASFAPFLSPMYCVFYLIDNSGRLLSLVDLSIKFSKTSFIKYRII